MGDFLGVTSVLASEWDARAAAIDAFSTLCMAVCQALGLKSSAAKTWTAPFWKAAIANSSCLRSTRHTTATGLAKALTSAKVSSSKPTSLPRPRTTIAGALSLESPVSSRDACKSSRVLTARASTPACPSCACSAALRARNGSSQRAFEGINGADIGFWCRLRVNGTTLYAKPMPRVFVDLPTDYHGLGLKALASPPVELLNLRRRQHARLKTQQLAAIRECWVPACCKVTAMPAVHRLRVFAGISRKVWRHSP